MRARARVLVPLASAAVCLTAYGVGPVPGLTHASASGSYTNLAFDKKPIAADASLGSSSVNLLTVTATSGGNGVAGATVFLTFVPNIDHPASATSLQCGSATAVSLGPTATPCTTDTNGAVLITYTTASTLPIGSFDTLSANNVDPSQGTPTATASTSYNYSKVRHYAFDTAPLASPGTASGTSGVTLSITAEDSSWSSVPTDNQNTTPPSIAIDFDHGATGTALLMNGACGTSSRPAATTGDFSNSFPLTSKATTAGVLQVCFWPPLSSTPQEIDTLTAQDIVSAAPNDATHNGAVASGVDGYNSKSMSSTPVLAAWQSPIASAGTLPANQSVAGFFTVTDGGSTVQFAPVTLAFTPATSGGTLTAGPQAEPLTVGTGYATDSSGKVTVQYTPGTATSGGDLITASIPGTSVTTNDNYNYATVSQYAFPSNTTPLAARGTLGTGSISNVVPVTVEAEDSHGNGVPYADLYVGFSPTAGFTSDQTSSLQQQGSTTDITSPMPFTTDGNGQVLLNYKADTALTGGQDTITVTGPNGSSVSPISDSYQFGSVASYVYSTGSSLAPTGSLPPGTPVNFTIEGLDSNSGVVKTAPIWVTFTATSGGGTLAPLSGVTTCEDQGKNSQPTFGTGALACLPDANGLVHLTYTAPNPLPTSGVDLVSAADAFANPVATGSISYGFVSQYVFGSTPFAATGTLGPSGAKTVTVTVEDDQGNPAPNASLMLALNGAGTASVSGTALTSTPQAFQANSSGVVSILYMAPASLPAGGADTISAVSDATATPAISASDTYTFVSGYTLSPAGPTIAPSGSLSGGTLKVITATPVDSQGTAAPGAVAWVSFTRASGGGSVTANGSAVGSSPTQVVADNSGHITIDYTAPGTPPSSGTDQVTIANQSSSPSVTSTDSYTFASAAPPPPAAPTVGYYMVASDGGLFSFGAAAQHFYGSMGGTHLNKPVVGMAAMPDNSGYYMVASDGGIFAFGSAAQHFYGSMGGTPLNQPVVGMAVMPDGLGYYLVARDGGIFAFGSAAHHFYGSMGGSPLNAPIVGMAVMPDGAGYYLVASDGGLFAFGSAAHHFYGSMGGTHLNQPVVSMAVMPDGAGYYMVATDGGLFSFGSAAQHFYGSMGGTHLNQPVVGMAVMPDGAGYYMVASDGGLFSFGSAANNFYGSMGGTHLNQPVVGMTVIS